MMIECSNLSKRYEIGDAAVEAVRDVNLRIEQGEFLAILGHSGSGKSTLLSMIGGLTSPSEGAISIDGKNIWSLNDNERAAFRGGAIGFIFQFSSLIPTLTVLDNVMLPSIFNGGMNEKVRERALRLLERVGLSDKIEAYPNEISGGQQRRVAISRAFVNEPKIVIADEPTGDLDEATEGEVMALFSNMRRERKLTILMVTHNRELTSAADRTIEMKGGAIR